MEINFNNYPAIVKETCDKLEEIRNANYDWNDGWEVDFTYVPVRAMIYDYDEKKITEEEFINNLTDFKKRFTMILEENVTFTEEEIEEYYRDKDI